MDYTCRPWNHSLCWLPFSALNSVVLGNSSLCYALVALFISRESQTVMRALGIMQKILENQVGKAPPMPGTQPSAQEVPVAVIHHLGCSTLILAQVIWINPNMVFFPCGKLLTFVRQRLPFLPLLLLLLPSSALTPSGLHASVRNKYKLGSQAAQLCPCRESHEAHTLSAVTAAAEHHAPARRDGALPAGSRLTQRASAGREMSQSLEGLRGSRVAWLVV